MASDLPLLYSPTHPTTITRHSDAFLTNLYHKNERLGEMVLSPQSLDDFWSQVFGNELRISSFSTSSERCLPLLVLHTISPGVAFKLAPSDNQQAMDLSALQALHVSCLHENKTAVAPISGGLQLHLVAMLPSQIQIPEGRKDACFWGFVVVQGMYDSCLAMLNLRCLAMVLDLDETLIVANTLKTFDDRIDALNRRLVNREDPVLAGTLKRFQEDKAILEQYIKTDQVYDNGKLYKAQSEVVPPVADGAIPLIRPIVRLPERNVILTRINPAVRDTSVLVRLRPNWDELKVYLLAKGRKRFEAFICTMSERDYALEMWRLLDPDARLINPRELNERVTCVKSDAKKALKDCFPRHCCHPKMAMVIDDRLPVWEKVDQPRVHEVQAFMPYTDPKGETMKELPPLCIARNIACNVRGYFFKELDETLTQQMLEVKFDTEVHTLPKAPDVSSYIIPEVMQEDVVPGFTTNGVKDFSDGMANMEVEMNLKTPGANGLSHSRSFSMDDDLMLALKQPIQQPLQQQQQQHQQPHLLVPDPIGRLRPQFAGDVSKVDPSMYLPGDSIVYPSSTENSLYPPGIPRRHTDPVQTRLLEGTIQGSPGREEGEVPEADIDPDTRRRLLILQHGMDASKPVTPLAPLQVQIPPVVPPGGGWLGIEEEMSPRRPSRRSPELVLEPESPSFDRSGPPGFENPYIREQQLIREAARRQRDQEESFFKESRSQLDNSAFSDEDSAANSFTRGMSREPFNAPRTVPFPAVNAISALHEIGQKVKRTVQYRTDLRSSTHLGVTVEVMFGGEKVGEGVGRTRKEAKYNAAESALLYLATKATGGSTPVPSTATLPEPAKEVRMSRGGPRDPRLSAGLAPLPRDDDSPVASTSGHVPLGGYQSNEEPVPYNHVAVLKELCTREAINIQFKALPSNGVGQRQAFRCQVEVGGRMLGRGSGPTWDEAKQEAAKEAYIQVEMSLRPHKRGNGPRSPGSNKRMRTDPMKDRGVPASLSPVRGGRSRLSPRRHARNLPPMP
ncbi:RNA polymerase II C-terminal domain phosphatase-like 1 [Physcomitrium patens]|uniref:protein-serine/threonine phosphatase n=1 Tax=Physcomitrium patens TaxID=3218 RepID=A0A2K1KAL8_PHYPA|nr:RNA polymerase II C-terminal domain phosphatase-like 1 [Physcomitrium patens]PNR50825.1 hypothetical protein PHYPA_010011 [Physcomitrium patens]|eukprot:XP_024380823.1 RNA polymerase II C-terminal domain phosphatase-like 1 [Physcomitrella patens]